MTRLTKIWLLYRKLLRLPLVEWRITLKLREKVVQSTLENVRLREAAAARCTKKMKRRVLKKQARKARAEHLVKCCLETGKKKAKREPLTELYVKGHFTEDREECQKEPERHCEEVYTD